MVVTHGKYYNAVHVCMYVLVCQPDYTCVGMHAKSHVDKLRRCTCQYGTVE